MRVFRRIFAIARKELRQLRRDRLTAGMIFGIPAIQIILFGFAINTDVRNLRGGWVDFANTAWSRDYVEAIRNTQVVEWKHRAADARELESFMRRGEIVLGLVIPADFDRRVLRGPGPPAQLLVDGSDPVVGNVAAAVAQVPAGLENGKPARSAEVRLFYNPEKRSSVQIIPALIGVILTMTMVLFTAVAIVRERERGTLEFLITTPVHSSELMTGKLLPYVAIGLVQVTLILLLAVFLFDVPVRGNLLDLYGAAIAYIATSLTLGLLISTLAQSQFQAMQMTFFYFLPSILLSGFMFPFDGMPPAAKVIGEILPLTHFVRLSRGILLRDATLPELSRELAPLALFGTVMLTLAILRFRKRLD